MPRKDCAEISAIVPKFRDPANLVEKVMLTRKSRKNAIRRIMLTTDFWKK
jgi:hypothetical protein